MLTISIAMLFLLEPVKAQGDDFLVCINDCDQLGRDYRFRNQVINQRRINQLPKWNNICQKLLKANLCGAVKSYSFKDGEVIVKVQGTEAFLMDIKFNSAITSAQALAIARSSFNRGQAFNKKKDMDNKIVLYYNPYDNYYLGEVHLFLNSQKRVSRIVLVSTTP
jgi:hypothetical protein